MKYIALLRGINVGGKSLVKMANLRESVTKAGFTNVTTLINSGNVIFESKIVNKSQISKSIEIAVSKILGKKIPIIIVTSEELKKVVEESPSIWKKKNNLRCYIAFIKKPVEPDDVLKEIKLNPDVDLVEKGPGVLYMGTLLSGITKSGFSRLASKKIYQDITIRNFKTVQKLLDIII